MHSLYNTAAKTFLSENFVRDLQFAPSFVNTINPGRPTLLGSLTLLENRHNTSENQGKQSSKREPDRETHGTNMDASS